MKTKKTSNRMRLNIVVIGCMCLAMLTSRDTLLSIMVGVPIIIYCASDLLFHSAAHASLFDYHVRRIYRNRLATALGLCVPGIALLIAAVFDVESIGVYVILASITLIPGIYFTISAIRVARGRKQAKIISTIARETNAQPNDLLGYINSNFNTSTLCAGKLRISPHWLLSPGTYGLVLVSTLDLTWVYKTETKKYLNGIYTGTAHGLKIHTRKGREFHETMGSAAVDSAIIALHPLAPWAKYGYF